MISWIATARRTDLLGRGGDRFVVGVGVQAVAVVEDRVQRLERGADVVEADLLRVQRPARGLDVVLEHLAARRGAVPFAHRTRPDPPGDPPDHRVLGVHAVGEEERQVRRERVDVHPARQVVLDDREAVGERERELRDRVRAGLGDVVAADRDAVEVADLAVDEILLDVAHHLQRELGREDARVLRLVLLEDVGLNGAADRLQRLGLDPLVHVAVEHHVARGAKQPEPEPRHCHPAARPSTPDGRHARRSTRRAFAAPRPSHPSRAGASRPAGRSLRS